MNTDNATAEPPANVSLAEAFMYWLWLGCISFGGPTGQIAIMHQDLVECRRWISEKRFLHALNYCMVLPGPEATQLATYAGWKLHGTQGGLAAGLLFVLPGDGGRRALAWKDARIDWDVVLLYGGGIALGELCFSKGLAQAAGPHQVTDHDLHRDAGGRTEQQHAHHHLHHVGVGGQRGGAQRQARCAARERALVIGMSPHGHFWSPPRFYFAAGPDGRRCRSKRLCCHQPVTASTAQRDVSRAPDRSP